MAWHDATALLSITHTHTKCTPNGVITHRAGNQVWKVRSQVLNVEEIVGCEIEQPEELKCVGRGWERVGQNVMEEGGRGWGEVSLERVGEGRVKCRWRVGEGRVSVLGEGGRG